MNITEARFEAQKQANKTRRIMLVISGRRIGTFVVKPCEFSHAVGAERVFPAIRAGEVWAEMGSRGKPSGCASGAESLACQGYRDEWEAE